MNRQPDDAKRPAKSFKILFSLLICGVALVLMLGALFYAAWTGQRKFDAAIPRQSLPALGLALRTFHSQQGHFPINLRELDAKVWKGQRAAQISADGSSLLAASGHYTYTYIRVSPVKAAIWAVPVGERYEEAATHFWYLTPTQVEKWMGPALTPANIGVMKTVPSESQLRWLMMTEQSPSTQTAKKRKTGLPFLPL